MSGTVVQQETLMTAPNSVLCLVVVVVVVTFPRVRGFWENVRQFVPRLYFFCLF